MPSDRPVWAFALTFAAAILMLVEGAILATAAGLLSSVGYETAAAALSDVGALGLTFGFILLVLSIGLYASDRNHGKISVAIIGFSILSLLGGGGFIIGIFLGCLGGVLGMMHVPASPDEDEFGEGEGAGTWSGLRRRPTPPRCPRCLGVVYSDEIACLRCGSALPGAD